MNRLYKLLFFCILYSLPFWNNSVAQTNTDLQAIALYNKANTEFNNASYEDALKYLQQAEELLGSTNSKILYLKIQTLDLLFKIDMQKAQQLQAAINQFYEVTNPDNYPKEKYMNVTSIEIDLKRRLKAHEADYLKLKGTEDIGEYDAFFSNYPGSKYEAALKPKYNQLAEQKKIADRLAFEKNWKEKNLPLLKEYQSKGRAMVGIGSTFLIAGVGMVAFSTAELYFEFTWPDDKPKTETVGWNTYDTEEYLLYSEELAYRFISMVSIGSATAVTGIILAPIGAKFINKSKRIKNEAKEKGIELSYTPIVSPVTQKYGVGFCMKF